MINTATNSSVVYVANCTLQNQVFQYATTFKGKLIPVTIKLGEQVRLPGELTGMETAYIEKLHRPYGLRRIEEIKNIKTFTGLVMSVGRPVPLGVLGDTIEHNREMLKKRGAEIRKESAIAAAQTVSGNNPEIKTDPNVKLGALEVEIVEEQKEGRDTEINETIRVTNSLEEASQTGARPRGGRRGR